MRRAAFAFVGTAVGTSLMIVTKLGPRPPEETAEVGQSGEVTASAAPGAATSAQATAQVSAAPGASTVPGAPGTTTGPAPTTKPPTTQAPPPGGLKNGTFSGPGVTQKYGTIKVTIVVSGGKITNATATYPTSGETGSINAKAIPKLNQATLTAQSASIATVSGATYTSNAYKQSLAAAINAAKA